MSYVPPHLRNRGGNPPPDRNQNQAMPPPNHQRPEQHRRPDTQQRRFNQQQQRAPPAQSNRFNNMFSGYDDAPRGGRNNYGRQQRGWGGDRSGGYGGRGNRSGGYGGRGRRGQRIRMELSTIPDPHYERELFGDQAEKMSAGINFDKYNDIPVEMSGEDCPEAIVDFATCGLHDQLAFNIDKCGFKVPTPIQKHSIPIVCLRRDLMACAQTGSGKTAAFLFPVIQNLLCQQSIVADTSKSRSRHYPRALILSPTRELSQQIFKEARRFLYCTGMRAVCIYGGSSIGDQFRELEGGVTVLVATPGRLFDMMERGKVSLSQCEYLVLDEADRMLDMGFEPQIRQIVQQADMISPQEGRNTLMFSATFPISIQELAQDFLINYIFVAVGRVGSTTDLITQNVIQAEEHEKMDTLLDLLPQCEGLKLVFTATKRGADQVEYLLCDSGVPSMSIHGDKTQRERETALRNFRQGRIDVLVATDVAARGLDIPNVLWVIQYDLPSSIDDYVHRIGRTGRCGNTGTAISFVNYGNGNVVRDLMQILQEAKQEIPTWFQNLCNNCRGGRKKGRSGRYGGRDYRKNKNNNNGGNRRRNNNGWNRGGDHW